MTNFMLSFGGNTKDGWLDVQAITIRVKNNSQFSESRKWLEDHSINSDREEKQKDVISWPRTRQTHSITGVQLEQKGGKKTC